MREPLAILFYGIYLGAAIMQSIGCIIAFICLVVYGPTLPELSYWLWAGINVVVVYVAINPWALLKQRDTKAEDHKVG